ncbi:MAG TPA: hypothetical protein VJ724_10515 [Tahibacter sp.]|nr:hypothetical protein [Tahibacter sp.]
MRGAVHRTAPQFPDTLANFAIHPHMPRVKAVRRRARPMYIVIQARIVAAGSAAAYDRPFRNASPNEFPQ